MRDYLDNPDRLVMVLPGLSSAMAMSFAQEAVNRARTDAPKLSGASSRRFEPVWGENYFGIHWVDQYVWFQERGINPFTMRNLAGKLIPMWVEDNDGSLRRENLQSRRNARRSGKTKIPKPLQRRVTADGRLQFLIFRRAAKQGERKMVKRRGEWKSVPRSYPGAPGRISQRASNGRIAQGNVGVRWRHPGLSRKGFMEKSLIHVALANGMNPGLTHATRQNWR